MDRDFLIEAICSMARCINKDESLKRIYNLVSRLLKKEAN